MPNCIALTAEPPPPSAALLPNLPTPSVLAPDEPKEECPKEGLGLIRDGADVVELKEGWLTDVAARGTLMLPSELVRSCRQGGAGMGNAASKGIAPG